KCRESRDLRYLTPPQPAARRSRRRPFRRAQWDGVFRQASKSASGSSCCLGLFALTGFDRFCHLTREPAGGDVNRRIRIGLAEVVDPGERSRAVGRDDLLRYVAPVIARDETEEPLPVLIARARLFDRLRPLFACVAAGSNRRNLRPCRRVTGS